MISLVALASVISAVSAGVIPGGHNSQPSKVGFIRFTSKESGFCALRYEERILPAGNLGGAFVCSKEPTVFEVSATGGNQLNILARTDEAQDLPYLGVALHNDVLLSSKADELGELVATEQTPAGRYPSCEDNSQGFHWSGAPKKSASAIWKYQTKDNSIVPQFIDGEGKLFNAHIRVSAEVSENGDRQLFVTGYKWPEAKYAPLFGDLDFIEIDRQYFPNPTRERDEDESSVEVEPVGEEDDDHVIWM